MKLKETRKNEKTVKLIISLTYHSRARLLELPTTYHRVCEIISRNIPRNTITSDVWLDVFEKRTTKM